MAGVENSQPAGAGGVGGERNEDIVSRSIDLIEKADFTEWPALAKMARHLVISSKELLINRKTLGEQINSLQSNYQILLNANKTLLETLKVQNNDGVDFITEHFNIFETSLNFKHKKLFIAINDYLNTTLIGGSSIPLVPLKDIAQLKQDVANALAVKSISIDIPRFVIDENKFVNSYKQFVGDLDNLPITYPANIVSDVLVIEAKLRLIEEKFLNEKKILVENLSMLSAIDAQESGKNFLSEIEELAEVVHTAFKTLEKNKVTGEEKQQDVIFYENDGFILDRKSVQLPIVIPRTMKKMVEYGGRDVPEITAQYCIDVDKIEHNTKTSGALANRITHLGSSLDLWLDGVTEKINLAKNEHTLFSNTMVRDWMLISRYDWLKLKDDYVAILNGYGERVLNGLEDEYKKILHNEMDEMASESKRVFKFMNDIILQLRSELLRCMRICRKMQGDVYHHQSIKCVELDAMEKINGLIIGMVNIYRNIFLKSVSQYLINENDRKQILNEHKIMQSHVDDLSKQLTSMKVNEQSNYEKLLKADVQKTNMETEMKVAKKIVDYKEEVNKNAMMQLNRDFMEAMKIVKTWRMIFTDLAKNSIGINSDMVKLRGDYTLITGDETLVVPEIMHLQLDDGEIIINSVTMMKNYIEFYRYIAIHMVAFTFNVRCELSRKNEIWKPTVTSLFGVDDSFLQSVYNVELKWASWLQDAVKKYGNFGVVIDKTLRGDDGPPDSNVYERQVVFELIRETFKTCGEKYTEVGYFGFVCGKYAHKILSHAIELKMVVNKKRNASCIKRKKNESSSDDEINAIMYYVEQDFNKTIVKQLYKLMGEPQCLYTENMEKNHYRKQVKQLYETINVTYGAFVQDTNLLDASLVSECRIDLKVLSVNNIVEELSKIIITKPQIDISLPNLVSCFCNRVGLLKTNEFVICLGPETIESKLLNIIMKSEVYYTKSWWKQDTSYWTRFSIFLSNDVFVSTNGRHYIIYSLNQLDDQTVYKMCRALNCFLNLNCNGDVIWHGDETLFYLAIVVLMLSSFDNTVMKIEHNMLSLETIKSNLLMRLQMKEEAILRDFYLETSSTIVNIKPVNTLYEFSTF